MQEDDTKMKRKDNIAFLRAEMTSLIVRETWERNLKKLLKAERLTHIITEKKIQQKEMIDKMVEFHTMKEAAIDKAAKKLLANMQKKEEKRKEKFLIAIGRTAANG